MIMNNTAALEYELRLVKLISGEMFIGKEDVMIGKNGYLVLQEALFVHVQVVQDPQTRALRVNHDVLPWLSPTIEIPLHAIAVNVPVIPESLERQYIAATSSIQIASVMPPIQ